MKVSLMSNSKMCCTDCALLNNFSDSFSVFYFNPTDYAISELFTEVKK